MDILQKFHIPKREQLNGSEQILVIDHHDDMRMILVHHLNKLNFHQTKQVSDGISAIEALQENKEIALIICDMDLPHLNGLELLTEIRDDIAINRPPFCIAMSNVSREKLMLAVETGVDEILVKPFTLGDIVPKIRKGYAVFHNPKNPEKLYELAKSKIQSKSFDDAEEIFNHLVESAPKSARPVVGLAKIAREREDLDQAFQHLANAETKNKDYVPIYTLKGDLYAQQQDYKNALASYKHAISLSPLNAYRYQTICNFLLEQKKYPEIIDVLGVALQHHVDFASLYHFLSQAHYHLKQYPESAKFMQKALAKDPENLKYLNQLALSLKENGDLDEARKTYNKVLKLDPDNMQALFNKAIMLHQNEQDDEAIKILKRVVAKYPDSTKAQQKLEEIQAKKSPKK